MNYTVNANIYETIDVNYKKKDSKGVLLLSEYKKEQVKKRAFSLSTGVNIETFTANEIIEALKTGLNLPEGIVDVKLTAKGNDLVGTEVVTSYNVKFEATLPCKTEAQVAAPPVVEETPVVEEPVAPAVEETPVVETPENPA